MYNHMHIVSIIGWEEGYLEFDIISGCGPKQ